MFTRFAFLFALLVTLSLPVTAQEITAEPTEQVVSTLESANIEAEPIVTEVPTVTIVQGANTFIDIGQSLLLIIVGTVTGGFVGIGAILIILRSIRNDEALLDAIEGLVVSAPPEVVETLQHLSEALVTSGEIIDMVSDGETNNESTATIPVIDPTTPPTDPFSRPPRVEPRG